MKKYKRIFALLLGVLGTGCILAAGILLIQNHITDQKDERLLEALQNQNTSPASDPETTPDNKGALDDKADSAPSPEASEPDTVSSPPEPFEEPENAAPLPEPVENPYRDSFLSNEDMAGWLQIPDTEIDYPIMWTPEDENYYLYRSFDKRESKNGCLILDTDSCVEPPTTNLIIHGHNMKSGAMFGNLMKYEKPEYFEEHRQIILYTPQCRRNYEVLAVFRSQVYKKTDQVFKFYKFFQADTQEEFDDFYNHIKELSLYDTGVTASFGDRFITLSTCAYHTDHGRFVVVARETDCQETYLPFKE
ncbi:MAG: class B sortase [Roseburia sp.]|nr:class B sortase [Roseburia sp.]